MAQEFTSKGAALKFFGRELANAIDDLRLKHISWAERISRISKMMHKMFTVRFETSTVIDITKDKITPAGEFTAQNLNNGTAFVIYDTAKKQEGGMYSQRIYILTFEYTVGAEVVTVKPVMNSGVLPQKYVAPKPATTQPVQFDMFMAKKIQSLHNRFENRRA